jgi:hypothetical protein
MTAARLLSPLLAAAFAAQAHAALFDVQALSVDTAAFQVTTNGQTGSGSGFVFSNTDLVSGAQNPFFAFSLTDPLNANNYGTVTTYTAAASPAWVDAAANQFVLRLPTFTMDWDTVPPPAGMLELCRPAKPCVVNQAPQNASAEAVGSWDPATGRYSVSWTYQWAAGQHPFPTGTTTWTLGGTAVIPEPATAALFVVGLLGLGTVARRRGS